MSIIADEEWRPVVDPIFSNYEVSSLGNVRRVGKAKNRILADVRGYRTVTLSEGSVVKHRKVHRLVANAFIPNSNNLAQINHKDGNKANNRSNNLEWCDESHNMRHVFHNQITRDAPSTHIRWNGQRQKYQITWYRHKVKLHLGLYSTFVDAETAQYAIEKILKEKISG